jgi:bifunctional N-acetylglucosamine-1-phosphate-uridyltransferase/glucosamine-1-phosphate-acetyltransferase GlmU-like protein
MNDEIKRAKAGGKVPNTAADVAEKINELYLALPKEIFTKKNSISHKQAPDSMGPEEANKIPNKGTILSKAVSYVETLQNDIDTGNRNEVDKKNEILGLLDMMEKQNISYNDILQDMGISKNNDLLASCTSAEVLLKELLDIGPLAGTDGSAQPGQK